MKNVLILAVVAGTAGSAIAAPLYSNRGGTASPTMMGLSTGPLTGSGVAAPAGFEWSECQNDGAGTANTVAGFTSSPSGTTGAFRLADDFTVTGPGWSLTGLRVFGYQTGSLPTATPITGGSVNIWDGDPSLVTSSVVATGAFAGMSNTNLYRVFSTTTPPPGSAPGTTRLIRAIDFTLSVSLAPGTYWIDFQLVPVSGSIFTPPQTEPGTRAFVTGSNAKQRTTTGWVNMIDTGNPAAGPDVAQDLPFLLDGTIIPAPGALALLGLGGLIAGRRRR
ncbi:MAG: hypothetical protein FJ255_08650 [Phycisphaerae bacterium]|nr:hypothetical protein [Phycisphaerae bacterium]